MKDKLLKILNQKNTRKQELAAKAQSTQDIAELRSINGEIETLNAEIADLNAMVKEIEEEEKRNATPGAAEGVAGMEPKQGEARSQEPAKEPNQELEKRGMNPIGTYSFGAQTAEERQKQIEKLEKRGEDLKNKRSVTFELKEIPEFRSVTLGSSNLVNPTQYSNTLNDTFNQVSSTIDLVKAVPLMGGEAYEKGFVKDYGEGDYTAEEGEYETTDPTFDYVSINKAKITAYTEVSEETLKLPSIDYQSVIMKNITIAIRKKISKQILAGAGGSNAVTGIFNAPTKVIPTASDITISEIDADTLDKIVFGYGGDEDVEGAGYLILNRNDLAKFAAIRTSTGEKLYKIVLNGNTGTISSSDSFQVPFVINSACSALSATGTASGTYCMAYGMMSTYEMPIFSALTVEESRDFKFKTGQIAYRGSIWAGGNVAGYKGFIRVKKA